MFLRYHLQEFGVGERPETAHEIFNLRHAKRRATIERCFAVLKGDIIIIIIIIIIYRFFHSLPMLFALNPVLLHAH